MTLTEIWLVRHGESTANVAVGLAVEAGLEQVIVGWSDADVPLSPIGEAQAAAFGVWLAEHTPDDKAITVWSSPYFRAEQTLTIALSEAHLDVPITLDERLRDREPGILERLTTLGVERRHPVEAARRRWLDKFHYRPPGGESWVDVAKRLRSFLEDINAMDVVTGAGKSANAINSTDAASKIDAASNTGVESTTAPLADPVDDGEAVGGAHIALIGAHDAVVMLVVHVCLGLTERQLLDLAEVTSVGNATFTRLVRSAPGAPWVLVDFANSDHLTKSGVPTTEHSGGGGAATD
ncbi:MAG: histidine phosphatase family protein [Glaciihabitans sp.]|nr:histidine phosphatase family protein [Glaciihabitans sp.]